MSGVDHVFVHAKLVDGTGALPLSDAWLRVAQGRVLDTGQGEPPPSPGALVHDANGCTLMPGLMDAHAHPANLDLDITTVPRYPPAVFVHKVSRVLEGDVALGFTTLRDAGGIDPGFVEATRQGFINGPRLFCSIAPLTQTGGHGDKRRFNHEAPIPRNSLGVLSPICDGPDDIRRAVRDTLRRGADQIKVMADGGVFSPAGSPGNPQFSVEELRVASETAEAAGSYVMAHVYCSKAVRNCIEAGVRSIEHATLMDAATAGALAESGAFLVPTLTVFDVLAKEGGSHAAALSQAYKDKLDRVREGALRSLEYAVRAGVRIASGSDLIGPFQEYKGRELALKAQVMGAMGAIVSATKTTAELMRVEDRLGTLQQGMLADVVMVEGDPLSDLSIFEPNSGKVRLVMLEGRVAFGTGVSPSEGSCTQID